MKHSIAISLETGAKLLLGFVTTLWLTGSLAAGLAGTKPEHHTLAGEKGAQGLMEFPEPPKLPSERETDWLLKLSEAWRAHPATCSRVDTIRGGHQVEIAIHCVGKPSQRPLLVFVHGILADYRTWRLVAGQLADDYEIWLVDLPGCGDSDAPDPGSTEADGYSASAMAERILQALEKSLAMRPDLAQRRIILVGHSLGGMTCLRMLSDPNLRLRHGALHSQIDGAVLMSTCNFEVNSVPAFFVPLLGLTGFKVSAAKFLGLFEPAVRDLVQRRFFVPECATAEQAELFAHMLADRHHRRATQAMLLQTVPFDPRSERPRWPAMCRMAQDCATITNRVLVVWGEWDEALPSSMGHALKDTIPGAKLVVIPGRGHSLTVEEPIRCAALVREFADVKEPGTLEQPPVLKLSLSSGSPVGSLSQRNGPRTVPVRSMHPSPGAWDNIVAPYCFVCAANRDGSRSGNTAKIRPAESNARLLPWKKALASPQSIVVEY